MIFFKKRPRELFLMLKNRHPSRHSPVLFFLLRMGSKLDMIKKNQNPSLDFEPWVKVVVLKKFVI